MSVNMTDCFDGQVALVTGAASGIGRAIARALAAAGADVAIADQNVDAAIKEVAVIEATGGSAFPVQVDVSNSDQCENMVASVVARTGALHILIHSAGIGLERAFLETTDEEWSRILQIDLSGSFYCMRAAGRHMAEAGYGRIVTLASTAGVAGGSGRAAYGAAKGGVIMLTRVLAVELAERGVTVNSLAPGAIETELVSHMHSSETRRNYTAAIPIHRYGTPEEVAIAALFLASAGAGYVTGHVLPVDGGFLAAGIINRKYGTGPTK